MRTEPARYIMIGGFLGAGKTTAVARLARHLSDRGLRVGLITNDQGSGLVDTRTLESRGHATREIAGGCFCCRFDSLVEAADGLEESVRPDFFLAEPVGSCTDLVATVTYPLRRMYGERFRIAPLSVLVDPRRARRILGLEAGPRFSPRVEYIYLKQLEEADLIVINKIDRLAEEARAGLREGLTGRFPRARVLAVSAREGTGVENWFARLEGDGPRDRDPMEMDYELYAQGEALLGWLNATIGLSTATPVDGNGLVARLAEAIGDRLRGEAAEIAHLKMTLSPREGLGDLAVVNMVGNETVPELGERLEEPVDRGEIILNLRAEAAPEMLERMVRAELAARTGLSLRHLECFRPGKPQPTWREGPPAAP